MVRWQPDAHGRLQQAAMELYLERGFDQVTVADIAERAGLTERTFFRYFDDKREVLFAGSSALQERLLASVAAAPADLAPLDVLALAFDDVATGFFGESLPHSRARQSVIDSHSGLQERELIKMAAIASTLADGLRQRGVQEPSASLAAESAVAAFRIAFARWVSGDSGEQLAPVLHESFAALRTIAGR